MNIASSATERPEESGESRREEHRDAPLFLI
jgi:hypothetical protein